MRAVAVIPARFASTRFPGKPLAPLLGRPMIAWVVEAATRAEGVHRVYVATDHEGIAAAAREAGAEAVMTSPHCASGTDRVAEVAAVVEGDLFVNLQGDEPLVEPEDIDALLDAVSAAGVRMATLARPLTLESDYLDANVVKVVCDRNGDALYFSRAPIPHYREHGLGGEAGSEGPGGDPVLPAVHLGLYAFSREALLAFPGLPRGSLERVEMLEQLRALEAGWKIRVVPARGTGHGVDAPADLEQAEAVLRSRRPGL